MILIVSVFWSHLSVTAFQSFSLPTLRPLRVLKISLTVFLSCLSQQYFLGCHQIVQSTNDKTVFLTAAEVSYTLIQDLSKFVHNVFASTNRNCGRLY